jgi:hypothetical protein
MEEQEARNKRSESRFSDVRVSASEFSTAPAPIINVEKGHENSFIGHFLMKTIGRKSHNPGSRHLCGKELRDAMKVSPKIIADVETASES